MYPSPCWTGWNSCDRCDQYMPFVNSKAENVGISEYNWWHVDDMPHLLNLPGLAREYMWISSPRWGFCVVVKWWLLIWAVYTWNILPAQLIIWLPRNPDQLLSVHHLSQTSVTCRNLLICYLRFFRHKVDSFQSYLCIHFIPIHRPY